MSGYAISIKTLGSPGYPIAFLTGNAPFEPQVAAPPAALRMFLNPLSRAVHQARVWRTLEEAVEHQEKLLGWYAYTAPECLPPDILNRLSKAVILLMDPVAQPDIGLHELVFRDINTVNGERTRTAEIVFLHPRPGDRVEKDG